LENRVVQQGREFNNEFGGNKAKDDDEDAAMLMVKETPLWLGMRG
jgi:hypothetical protein